MESFCKSLSETKKVTKPWGYELWIASAVFDACRIYHAGGYINNPNRVRIILQLSYATKSPAKFKDQFNKLDLFFLSSFQKIIKFFQVKIYN